MEAAKKPGIILGIPGQGHSMVLGFDECAILEGLGQSHTGDIRLACSSQHQLLKNQKTGAFPSSACFLSRMRILGPSAADRLLLNAQNTKNEPRRSLCTDGLGLRIAPSHAPHPPLCPLGLLLDSLGLLGPFLRWVCKFFSISS